MSSPQIASGRHSEKDTRTVPFGRSQMCHSGDARPERWANATLRHAAMAFSFIGKGQGACGSGQTGPSYPSVSRTVGMFS